MDKLYYWTVIWCHCYNSSGHHGGCYLGPKLHPGDGFFGPWFFIILKDSHHDEGPYFIFSSLEVGHWVFQTSFDQLPEITDFGLLQQWKIFDFIFDWKIIAFGHKLCVKTAKRMNISPDERHRLLAASRLFTFFTTCGPLKGHTMCARNVLHIEYYEI